MSGAVTVRVATPADVPAVTAIYNAGIRGRRATFETVEPTPADVHPWLEGPHPFLVATAPDHAASVL